MSTHQHIDKLYAQLKLLHCGVLTEMHLRFIFFLKQKTRTLLGDSSRVLFLLLSFVVCLFCYVFLSAQAVLNFWVTNGGNLVQMVLLALHTCISH